MKIGRYFSGIMMLLFSCFLIFSCASCGGTDAVPPSDAQIINNVAERFLKASVKIAVFDYYETEADLGGKKKGFMFMSTGSGYIYGQEHWLFTAHHVLDSETLKTFQVGQMTPLGPMVGEVVWQHKKSRYFIVRDCSAVNAIAKATDGFVKEKAYRYPDIRMFMDQRPFFLDCVSEQDFDDFFSARQELAASQEFYLTPDSYRSDPKNDSAGVRLKHLDGQLDYVTLSDHDTEHDLMYGETIYIWGAPRMIIEQLYKGVSANIHLEKLVLNKLDFDTKNFALTDMVIVDGSSGSMLFRVNERGEGKIVGIASFMFPPPPFSVGYAFIKIGPFLKSLGFIEKP
ncbi:MAG: hypothetical protein V1867_08145 [Candidatus Falkowbacteria bacterium]